MDPVGPKPVADGGGVTVGVAAGGAAGVAAGVAAGEVAAVGVAAVGVAAGVRVAVLSDGARVDPAVGAAVELPEQPATARTTRMPARLRWVVRE
jgi:hypothetical protein